MAIQSQLYSENFGFGLGGRGVVSQDNYVENGFGMNGDVYLNLQQQQQQFMEFQQQQQEQKFQFFLQQKNESLCFEKSGFGPKNHSELMNFSGTILAQMEKQRQEIDQFISVQNERLKLALLEHRKQQISTILRKLESRAAFLLRQKDEEIAKHLNKRIEFENMIRAMEIECQTWQRVAKENEAIVMSLTNTIEQLKQSDVCLSLNNNNNGVAEDAESCCDNNVEFQENEQEKKVMNVCRSCNSWESCVILLPCRHLCSCKACDAFLDSCPVCGMVKKSSIEVLF